MGALEAGAIKEKASGKEYWFPALSVENVRKITIECLGRAAS
jgi:hypothetical protein